MFLIKKKVTKQVMGFIICEVARIRTEELRNHLENEKTIEYNDLFLNIYTFVYNFYIIQSILHKKYSEEIVQEIINNAYELFYLMLKEQLSLSTIEKIKNDIDFTVYLINETMSKNFTGGFDNPLREMSKLFLNDISDKDDTQFDELIIMDICIEMASWYKSDYLLTKYKVV